MRAPRVEDALQAGRRDVVGCCRVITAAKKAIWPSTRLKIQIAPRNPVRQSAKSHAGCGSLAGGRLYLEIAPAGAGAVDASTCALVDSAGGAAARTKDAPTQRAATQR